jgi:hypothetical protein
MVLVIAMMIVITVKITMQLLMLLLMRIARWRKKAKIVLLATVTLFRRTQKIIMGIMNYFLVILDLKSQQSVFRILCLCFYYFLVETHS